MLAPEPVTPTGTPAGYAEGLFQLPRPFSPLVFLLLSAACLRAAELKVVPDTQKQGEVVEVYGNGLAKQARMNGKTIPLYPQNTPDDTLGLMPVPVRIEPGLYKLEWLDAQGAVISTHQVRVLNAHYTIQNVQLPPTVAELKSTSGERDEVSKFFDKDSGTRYWELPITPPLHSCLTSMFGVQRAINGKLTGDIHAGLDQRGGMGTPIHAVAAGDVRLAGQFALHGGTVGIDHGQGLKSMYLHMSKIAAHPGDHVAVGDVIGYVGSTGRSTAPHLHWALYAAGEPVNPLQWLNLEPCAARKETGLAKRPAAARRAAKNNS